MSDATFQDTKESIVRKPTPEERAKFFGAFHAESGSAGSAPAGQSAAAEDEVPTLVSRQMLIGELLALYPDSAYALMQCGMGCISCGAAQLESIEEASMVHGLDPDEIVDFLNYKLGLIPLDAD